MLVGVFEPAKGLLLAGTLSGSRSTREPKLGSVSCLRDGENASLKSAGSGTNTLLASATAARRKTPLIKLAITNPKSAAAKVVVL